MAKKIQLQDANGNVLHPLTLGECVTMSNGENLDTLMSKSQMFTPTITQDKSMFKVGTGIDVDYSANVKDGAYESLMFKGKSLVNLCPNGVINYTATSDWDGYNGIGQASNTQGYSWKTLQDLKPNTKYFISCYVETFDVAEGQYYLLNNRNDSTVFGDSLYIRTTGLHKWVLTSKSEFTEAVHIALRCQNAYARGAIKIRDIMIIEYQEGMEEWDIPYFEGICDVKMPILRNVGKNIIKMSEYDVRMGATVTSEGENWVTFDSPNAWGGLCYRLQLKPNTAYSFSFDREDNDTKGYVRHWINNREWSGGIGGGSNYSFTTNDTGKVYLSLESATVRNGVTVKNLMLEESPINTQYEDYKTNILHTSEEIVLREVNGVQDTYNPLTGEYVRRIGEVVFDGSSDEDWSVNKNIVGGKQFVYNASLGAKSGNATVISDKLPSIVDANESHVENIWIYNGTTIVIHKNLQDANELKTWLSQNPITVQYELAEPITTIIKPSTMTPFAYQNGHVIVESGFEGQSLLPEIEYSVVTGRTGQVTQNTKVLRQQEQQIIGLEELLLTQVVQMEYERTLLQFDYELQMMMLG